MDKKSLHLSLSHFDYFVPDELVAQEPLQSRDQSKLLAFKSGQVAHHKFADLPDVLPKGSLLIRNVTQVLPSRLFGQLKTGGKVELFLLEKPQGLANATCRAIGRPMRKIQVGTELFFEGDLVATVMDRPEDVLNEGIGIEFNASLDELLSWLDKNGITPLPPYIARKIRDDQQEAMDKIRYQTVYAKNLGSVAAPTAGLHFTDEILAKLSANDVEFADVVLHVGAGTFMPVRTEDVSEHKMHSETYYISASSYDKIAQAVEENRPVFYVGTTSFRAVESFFKKTLGQGQNLKELLDTWLETDLFVYPETSGYVYKPYCGDGIITNFHQPCSTLLMLISALVGVDEVKDIYREAVENRYRFFSYGDSSLLWFKKS